MRFKFKIPKAHEMIFTCRTQLILLGAMMGLAMIFLASGEGISTPQIKETYSCTFAPTLNEKGKLADLKTAPIVCDNGETYTGANKWLTESEVDTVKVMTSQGIPAKLKLTFQRKWHDRPFEAHFKLA